MKEIKILIFINILCMSSMMAFLSIIGPLVRKLNLLEWHAGLTVSAGGILWVLLSKYWGKKSDQIGRKPILLTGILGVAISYFILAIFVDITVENPPYYIFSLLALILTRGSLGAFYSSITPVSNALIADNIKKEKRTSYIAKLSASNGIGMILGPAIGGFLTIYGLSAPLYFFSFLPLLAFIVLIYSIKNKKPIQNKKKSQVNFLDKRLRLPIFAAFITMFAIITSQVCMGFYVIDILNLELIQSAKITGYILSCIGFIFILSQILIAKINFNPYFLLKFGSLLSALGYFLVCVSLREIDLTIGFSIGTFGIGMLFPSFQTLALNLVAKEEQGEAAGTVSAAQGLGMVISPLVSTYFYSLNPTMPFAFIIIIFLILFFSSYVFSKKNKLKPILIPKD